MTIRFPQTDSNVKKLLQYVWSCIAVNKGFEIIEAAEGQTEDIEIIPDTAANMTAFYRKLKDGQYNVSYHFADKPVILQANGEPCYEATIYYLINCVQEYGYDTHDRYKRFAYTDSLQKRYDIVTSNLVQQYIDALCDKYTALKGQATKHSPSRILLTHDLDFIYNAWKEDGLYALRTGRWWQIPRLVFNQFLARPDWLNMDKIMQMEDEQGMRSVFYWLLQQDKPNADYNFKDKAIQKQYAHIEASGWESGLHKSMANLSFSDEIQRLGKQPLGNRYHFLKFNLPGDINVIESSDIPLDTTLGFHDAAGFRNSYGLPFVPFKLDDMRPARFVEVPLHIMDRTFFNKRLSINQVRDNIFGFIDKNSTDAVICINWHNNFFTNLKYKGYRQLYAEILLYCKQKDIRSISQKEIIDQYGHLPLFS